MDEEETKAVEIQEANGASTEEDIEAIKAQLGEEQKAKADLTELITGKDARITELETQAAEFTQQLEGKTKEMEDAAAKLANVSGSLDTAVAKYLGVAKALNPNVPEDIIGGATVEEIDSAITRGKAIVEAVRKTMDLEAATGKVPAGAPVRGGVSTEGMTPREMIAAGIKPK